MTETALLDALRKAATRTTGGEGMRVEEIRRELKCSAARARDMIREGLATGTIRRTSRSIEGLDGRMVTVPGYAITKKAKR
jgi:hypothetical protein